MYVLLSHLCNPRKKKDLLSKKVYKLLLLMLDDFGPANWTSELRNCVPGFTPFQGQAYADFTYHDTQGQLTRKWLGPEKAAEWNGRWPRYHIEVKSTRGEDSEPFHISRAQMITVRPHPLPVLLQLSASFLTRSDRRLLSRSEPISVQTCTSSCASHE
jgi:hypothetical protein